MIKTYRVSDTAAGPYGITAGPDGERFAMMGPSSEDWTEEDDEDADPDDDGADGDAGRP